MNESQARKIIVRRAKSDPIFHISTLQGCNTLVPYQKRICERLKTHNRVAVKACHGSGKTFVAARIVLWFGSTQAPCKGITTAPTYRQVEKLLWSEIRAGYSRSPYPLGGQMMNTEWRNAADWFLVGYSPQVEAGADESGGTASTFQGYHSPNMIFILDEATGIRRQIWSQMEGMTTGGHFKMLAIGNPTSRQCEFYNCFHGPKASLWAQETITCFDSPNLQANGIIDIPSLTKEWELVSSMDQEHRLLRIENYEQPNDFLLTARWVMERALEWGITHPLFRGKALAEFPDEDDKALFTLSQIENSILRVPRETVMVRRRSIGVDPARFGSDKTIITVIDDDQVVEVLPLLQRRTTEVAGTVIHIARTMDVRKIAESVVIAVDGTGLGAGVVDNLVEAVNAKNLSADVYECHFGGTPAWKSDPESVQNADKEHYANFKAKIFHMLSKALSSDLCLPAEQQRHEPYQIQLPTIQYSFDSKGRMKIESKEDYTKRTGRGSPDESDSLALANWGRHIKIFMPNIKVSRL